MTLDHKTTPALERGTRIHSQIEAYLRGYQRDALESLRQRWREHWSGIDYRTLELAVAERMRLYYTPTDVDATLYAYSRWHVFAGRGYGKSEAQRVAEAKAAAEHEVRLAERLSRRVAAVAVLPDARTP